MQTEAGQVQEAAEPQQEMLLLGAIAHAKYPLDDSDAWDGDAARKRMRSWASSDGSGDWDKVNHAKYAKGFAYVADMGEHESDYKLPHHDVKDGALVTVWGGVKAAGGSIQGARGTGAAIPVGELATVKKHLAEHYREFDREAPWEGKHNSQVAALGENLLALLRDEPNAAIGEAIPMPRIGGEPPKEFRAFKWGDNPTTKGLLKLTPEGAQLIMDAFRARQVVLCFDYFHATYNPAAPAESRKAAGQTVPELRPDGLWYANIQWTPAAAQAIRDGEWPYISPGVMHNKAGVIIALKNPGLVTDPGIIGAIPTVLSGLDAGPSPKGTPMADKKRMVLDAYGALESALRRCQALADTDGTEKDLGSRATGHIATALDAMRAHMGPLGMMDDAASLSRLEAGKDRVMASLSAELGETDPDKLLGKFLLRLGGSATGNLVLSATDEASVKKLLLDGHSQKVPTMRRPALESGSLTTLITFLSGAPDIVPTSTVNESPPKPPTSTAPKEAMPQNPAPNPGTGDSAKPMYSQLDAQKRAQIDEIVAAERKMRPADFNEQTARESAMTLLSDWEAPADAVSRHMPVGGVDGRPPAEGRA